MFGMLPSSEQIERTEAELADEQAQLEALKSEIETVKVKSQLLCTTTTTADRMYFFLLL